MDFSSISIILLGSTFGLILRIFIQNNFKKSIGFDIRNTSIVNFLSSFLLGILVTLNFINNEILVLFYSGFLGVSVIPCEPLIYQETGFFPSVIITSGLLDNC